MKRIAIKEEDKVHLAWFEEAKSVTIKTLPEFVRKLTEDYSHDYGTICHAMTAAMKAAMNAVNESPQGGITGFQAGCVMWGVLEHAFHEKGPMRLVRYENLLYPQYRDTYTSISPSTWKWVQDKATQELGEQRTFHPDVRAHLKSIVAGQVPFGLGVHDC